MQFDPPPGIVIPPEMVEVMRKEGVTQAYTPESIMRWAGGMRVVEVWDESGMSRQSSIEARHQLSMGVRDDSPQ